jgi:hypothetical protein
VLRKPSYFFAMNIFFLSRFIVNYRTEKKRQKKKLYHTIKAAWSRIFLETPEAVFGNIRGVKI